MGEVEVLLYSFLTLLLHGGQRSVSRPAALPCGSIRRCPQSRRAVGPTGGVDDLERVDIVTCAVTRTRHVAARSLVTVVLSDFIY